MSYQSVFGGNLIFPSQTSFVLITTAIDAELQWPTEQQITDGLVVADFINVDPTAAGVSISMPSATIASTGNKATFNNIGADDFDVLDFTGGAIQTVAPGEQWVIVLTDNSTDAGTWLTFQMGASVSVASAAALAGAGIKAISATLNQKIDADTEAATPFTVVDADRARCLIYTAGAGVCNLPDPGVVGADWFFMLRNSGSGTLSVVAAAGDVNGAASISMDPEDSCFLFTDGADFYSLGLSAGSSIAFDFVSIPVAGSGDFTLSGANLNRISYRFTGLLTGNRTIIVPATAQQYWVDNQTTGAFTLAISTLGQVGPPEVTQGQTATLFCDGTNVLNANSSSSVVVPLTVGQGGTGATNVADAQTNLQVPPTSRQIIAGVGLSGGGNLSADRTLTLDLSELTTDTAVDPTTDFIPYRDTGAGDDKKILIENLFNQQYLKVVKTSVEIVNNSSALQDDNELFLSVEANSSYKIELFIYWGTNNTGSGFKFQFSAPASAFAEYVITAVDELGTSLYNAFAAPIGAMPSAYTFTTVVTNPTANSIRAVGHFETQANAGTLQLRWAQSVATGTDTSVFNGSYLILTKLN